MPRLILLGGGHAQLSVLHALASQYTGLEAVLVTPSPYQIYSGMLPGWMAGHYRLDECRIDLRPLADKARVRLQLAYAVSIDARQRKVALSDGTRLDYDLLSIDLGSETETSLLQAAGERLLPVKPLGDFVARWPQIVQTAAQKNDYQLAVVGGGAAGVELAFAAQYAFAKASRSAQVALVYSESGLLPGHAANVKRRAESLLRQRGIRLIRAQAMGAASGLQLSSGGLLPADCILAATGARPAAWLAQTGLAHDEHGYLLVDAAQRSVSHPEVFAAGDVCVRDDIRLPRSGVHAVFAGPVLAHNLLVSLHGEALIPYRPKRKSLYLLATGPQHAIASWGGFSAQGHWVWRWKNWIDRRFMRKHGVREEMKT
ncbi:MAG: FAD-dependent oxidoreductase [Sideroxydans sp.]